MRLSAALALAASLFAAAPVAARTFSQPPPEPAAPIAPSVFELPVAAPIVLDRARLTAALTARRKANLAHFRAYVAAGVYPSNLGTDAKRHVWIDVDGHLCAAATMIAASGASDLAFAQPAIDNGVRLADVRDGALYAWILTSGFTQAEIARIQEPFMDVDGRVGRMQPIAEPIPTPTVDVAARRAEDRRLRRVYRATDRALARGRQAALRQAVDALMARPDLAIAAFGPDIAT